MNSLLEFAQWILSVNGECSKRYFCDSSGGCPAFNVRYYRCEAIPASHSPKSSPQDGLFWVMLHVQWANEYIEEQKKLEFLSKLSNASSQPNA
jgi:hypothetical protein